MIGLHGHQSACAGVNPRRRSTSCVDYITDTCSLANLRQADYSMASQYSALFGDTGTSSAQTGGLCAGDPTNCTTFKAECSSNVTATPVSTIISACNTDRVSDPGYDLVAATCGGPCSTFTNTPTPAPTSTNLAAPTRDPTRHPTRWPTRWLGLSNPAQPTAAPTPIKPLADQLAEVELALAAATAELAAANAAADKGTAAGKVRVATAVAALAALSKQKADIEAAQSQQSSDNQESEFSVHFKRWGFIVLILLVCFGCAVYGRSAKKGTRRRTADEQPPAAGGALGLPSPPTFQPGARSVTPVERIEYQPPPPYEPSEANEVPAAAPIGKAPPNLNRVAPAT